MKSIQLNVTLDSQTIESFAEVIRQAVEDGINRAIHGTEVTTTHDAGSARRKAVGSATSSPTRAWHMPSRTWRGWRRR